jgi:tetratricopeptide (TPR) repeat protein
MVIHPGADVMGFVIAVWMAPIFIAWIFLLSTFLLYANYKGWLEFEGLASLGRPRLYLLLRCFRTFTLLFISVSIIAFLYFESDFFMKKIPDFEVTLTPAQYEQALIDRSRLIAGKIQYADKVRAGILETQKEFFEEKLIDFDQAYGEHVEVLAGHVRSLKKIYRKAPSDLLNKARHAMAEGNLMEADIFLEAIGDSGHLDADAAGRLAWARGFIAKQSADYQDAYNQFSSAARFMPDNMDLQIQAAWAAYMSGDYRVSKSHYEAVLANDILRYGASHPQVAVNYKSLGTVAADMGNYHESFEYFNKALVIDIKAYGEEHPEVVSGHYNTGWALERLREYRKALPHLERALASDLKKNGKNDHKVLGEYSLLGDIWTELGDYRKSVMYNEQALNSGMKVYGKDHIKLAKRYHIAGWLWARLAEYEKAVTHYERALAIYQKHYPVDHPEVVDVRHELKIVRGSRK